MSADSTAQSLALKKSFLDALSPLLEVVRTIDPSRPDAAETLSQRLPLGSEAVTRVRELLRKGVDERWLCEREHEGVRFSRVLKAEAGAGGPSGGLSIDAVHMSTPGGSHVHPNGEIDLCFAVSGSPRFDGRPEGWTVYAPNSWHTPTVQGGAMDILYCLPGGAIRFGPKPDDAVAVGLDAVKK